MRLINKLSSFALGAKKEITIHDIGNMYRVQLAFIEDNECKVTINETYYEYSIAYARFLDIKDQWFAIL